jgi:HTH-type transcriptional regulator / antitoxin HigA
MDLKPLQTEAEYDRLMEWVDNQFDQKPDLNSPERHKLQIALLLIKAYEDEHHQIPLPDPI